MTTYYWLSIVTCAGHLTLALIALSRVGRAPLAMLMAVLALNLMTWNGADVAGDLVSPIWNTVDYAASSLTMPIVFHFVLAFVGGSRRFRKWIVLSYSYFGAISALGLAGLMVEPLAEFSGGTTWALLLLLGLVVELPIAIWTLVMNARNTANAEEVARTRLVFMALVVGVLLGCSDLLRIVEIPVPRTSNVGTLISAVLLGVAALRFNLFERNVSLLHAMSAVTLVLVAALTYVIVFLFAGQNIALLALGTVAVTVFLFAAMRQLINSLAAQRHRHEYLATLGRCSGLMVHNLGNPITAAKGAMQFLKEERRQGRSLDEQGEYLDLIEEQLERLQQTVEEYKRIGRVEPQVQSVDVNEMASRTIAGARQGARPDVEIAAELDESLRPVLLDENLLCSALENLIRNALQALPGKGRIVVRTHRDRSQSRAGFVLSVADNGVGMNPRVAERVFEDFYTTKAQGSGIGLSFVRRVAEAHRGRAWIHSTEGQGTEVNLWLPFE